MQVQGAPDWGVQALLGGSTAGTTGTTLDASGIGAIDLRPTLVQLVLDASVRFQYTGLDENGAPIQGELGPAISLSALNATFEGCDVPPLEETAPPVEETAPPAEETAPPIEETAPPVEDTAPPAEEEAAPPVDDTVPPVEDPVPPVDETAPPAEEAAAPVDKTAPPVDDTAIDLDATTAPL
ncbi:hypothetical protein [Microbacterium sp. UFMG61]|uniref:hypothetical protein n=1 Tax=Microbacterium sp. UFMG61 TaxID=2745935 RepID=UPI00188E2B23|nr:hypothetical protein [Microbacterium sp. UFMG61]